MRDRETQTQTQTRGLDGHESCGSWGLGLLGFEILRPFPLLGFCEIFDFLSLEGQCTMTMTIHMHLALWLSACSMRFVSSVSVSVGASALRVRVSSVTVSVCSRYGVASVCLWAV